MQYYDLVYFSAREKILRDILRLFYEKAKFHRLKSDHCHVSEFSNFFVKSEFVKL